MTAPLPKVYAAIKIVNSYTIAQKKTDKLFYIFDNDGGINKEVAFISLERAEKYVPTIDHMVAFSDRLAGSRYVPTWRKR